MSDYQIKILLVEDNPGDARLIQESLADAGEGQFNVETADRLATALLRLAAGGVDATLLDLALPDSTGWDTFEKVRVQSPGVPIIVLTGLSDDALAVKMVQKGAQDFVAKVGLNGGVLPRAIRYAIERERTDQQIRKFNEDLERRVLDRTAELEAANQELESFSYSVSHDLRGPIRHINGYCSILVEDFGAELSPEARNCIQKVRDASTRMGCLVDDLLRLAQVSRQELKAEETDLGLTVKQALNELAADLMDRKIEWKIGPLPTVICDAGLVKQVFANLIGNAIKYTRGRENAVIEIGHEGAGEVKTLFVRDNGAGFDMQYAGKLFGAFQRLHKQDEFEGTGIGLATVHRIVQKHGGRVWAEAELDRGATFYFTLSP
ncbi:MAG: ATP-binding protein [Candidatus Acidiferrales bacterium]